MRVGPDPEGLVSVRRGHLDMGTRTQGECSVNIKMAVCKPKMEAGNTCKSANTWTSDF